jgi:hypothetical protein
MRDNSFENGSYLCYSFSKDRLDLNFKRTVKMIYNSGLNKLVFRATNGHQQYKNRKRRESKK